MTPTYPVPTMVTCGHLALLTQPTPTVLPTSPAVQLLTQAAMNAVRPKWGRARVNALLPITRHVTLGAAGLLGTPLIGEVRSTPLELKTVAPVLFPSKPELLTLPRPQPTTVSLIRPG